MGLCLTTRNTITARGFLIFLLCLIGQLDRLFKLFEQSPHIRGRTDHRQAKPVRRNHNARNRRVRLMAGKIDRRQTQFDLVTLTESHWKQIQRRINRASSA